MNREEKDHMITVLEEKISNNKNIYLTDISGLDAGQTINLRRLCFSRDIALQVVKNNLLKKAMEKSEKDFEGMYDMLVGNTSLMISEVGNAPAKVIKEFKKKTKSDKPLLKTALIDNALFLGNECLEELATLKSKEELIGEVITLLQSPIKNLMSSLNSGKRTISGILTTLADREAPENTVPGTEVASEEKVPGTEAASEDTASGEEQIEKKSQDDSKEDQE